MRKSYVVIFSVALAFLIGCEGRNSDWSEGDSNATDVGNESSGSWLDCFPQYDDSTLAIIDSHIGQTNTISASKCEVLESNLISQGFTEVGNTGEFSRGEAHATIENRPKACFVEYALTKSSAKATEADLSQAFNSMPGIFDSIMIENSYASISFDESSYKSALEAEGFKCSPLACRKCEKEKDEECKYNFSDSGIKTQTFSKYKTCQVY